MIVPWRLTETRPADWLAGRSRLANAAAKARAKPGPRPEPKHVAPTAGPTTACRNPAPVPPILHRGRGPQRRRKPAHSAGENILNPSLTAIFYSALRAPDRCRTAEALWFASISIG